MSIDFCFIFQQALHVHYIANTTSVMQRAIMVQIRNIERRRNVFCKNYLLLFISRALTRVSPLPSIKAEKFDDSVFTWLLLKQVQSTSTYLFTAKCPPFFTEFRTNIFCHILCRYPCNKASVKSYEIYKIVPDTMRRIFKAYQKLKPKFGTI